MKQKLHDPFDQISDWLLVKIFTHWASLIRYADMVNMYQGTLNTCYVAFVRCKQTVQTYFAAGDKPDAPNEKLKKTLCVCRQTHTYIHTFRTFLNWGLENYLVISESSIYWMILLFKRNLAFMVSKFPIQGSLASALQSYLTSHINTIQVRVLLQNNITNVFQSLLWVGSHLSSPSQCHEGTTVW